MPKFSIKSDLLAPAASKTIQYVGSNPGAVFKLAPDFMQDALSIDPGSVWEDEIRWDASGDPVSFYGTWRGKIKKDNYTTIWVIVEVRGTQDKERKGDVSVKLKGSMTTSFSYKYAISKAIFNAYRYMFYNKQKIKYIEDANKAIDVLENLFRTRFELMRRAG